MPKGFISSFDYVEISESGDHDVISRYCDWNNVTYISASNNLKITFHSDISYQDKGFEFKYEIKRKGMLNDLYVINCDFNVWYICLMFSCLPLYSFSLYIRTTAETEGLPVISIYPPPPSKK